MIPVLFENAILLVALSTLYGFALGFRKKNEKLFKIFFGVIGGFSAILSMLLSYHYSPTIFLDARTIVLVIIGLFGGALSSLISVFIATIYRLSIGGAGMIAGLAVIFSSAITGLAFRRYYKNRPDRISPITLYLIGIITHVLMIGATLLNQPFPIGIYVIKETWFTIITIYPVATLLVGLLVRNEEIRYYNELELKEKEENLRTTLNSIGDAVIVTDTEGKIVRMNPVAESLTGFTFQEAINKDIEEIFRIYNSITNQKAENPVKRVLTSGKVVGLANNTKLISKSGKEFQIADSASPIKDDNGNLKGVVFVFRDVTEDYELRQALIKSEEKFRKTFETSPDSVNINRMSDGKYVSVNDGFLRIMGYTKEEVIGRTSLELNIWANPEDRRRLIEELKKNGIVENFEAPFRAKDGSIKIGLMSAAIIELDGEPHIVNVTRDITHIKRQERLIKRYSSILEKSLNEVYIIDSKTWKFIQANNAALRNLGYNINELMEFTPADISPEFTKESFQNLTEDLYNGRKDEVTFETVHKRKDGSLYNVEVHLQLIKIEDEEFFAAIVLDITKRKEVENALLIEKKNVEVALERLREAEEIAHVGNWVIDLSTGYFQLSDGAYKVFGIPIGSPFSINNLIELVHPEDRTNFINNWNDWLRLPTQKHYEHRIIVNGKVHWIRHNCNLSRSTSTNVIGTVIDITDIKEAEETIKLSEQRLRLILESTRDIIFTLDRNFVFTGIYGSELDKLGISPDNLIGKTYHNLMKSAKFISDKDIYKRTLDGENVIYETEILINNEEIYFQVSLSPLINTKGFVEGIVGIARNITDKKRQEILEAVLYDISKISYANISVHDYVKKIHHHITRLMKADNFYVALYDKESDTYTFLYHKDQFDDYAIDTPYSLKGSLTDYVRRTGKAQLITKEKDVTLRNEGETILVGSESAIWLGAPLIDMSTGEIIGVMVLQDYFDSNAYSEKDLFTLELFAAQVGQFIIQVKTLQDLRIAKEKAESSEKMKSEFLAQMSHEIRSPINIIYGSLELIKEEVKDKVSQELISLFVSIDNASKRIIRTIDLILNYSELQASLYSPIYTQLDLKEDILEPVVLEYKRAAENKGLSLNLYCEIENTKLKADEYSVTQIFVNLIDNAIKYTPSGKVEIELNRNSENQLVVKVKDTGIGMSEEFLENIFEPFLQEETGYTRSFEGNGLGLALVKKYCEINNADIFVESKKGIGSVFTVVFK